MNRTRTAVWLTLLAIIIAWGRTAAPAGEVTVIGAAWNKETPPVVAQVEYAPEFPRPSPEVIFSAKPEVPNLVFPSRPFNTAWYTRLEYLHWDERLDRTHQNIESGPLYTLGGEHRFGSERIRGELFTGNMHFGGYIAGQEPSSFERTYATIGYFGGRAEYEYLWDVNVEGWLPVTLYAGLGTRIWNKSAFNIRTASGEPIASSTQAWWTIYPYVGVEKRWDLDYEWEFFGSGRIGCTVINYNHTSSSTWPAYYPNPGITGQLECGLRRGHLFLSAYFEATSWQASQAEHLHGGGDDDWYRWPTSQMFTSGFEAGFTY